MDKNMNNQVNVSEELDNRSIVYKIQKMKLLPTIVYDRISKMNLNQKINLIIFISAVPILFVTLISVLLLGTRIQSNISDQLLETGKSAKNTVHFYLKQTHIYSKMIAENQLVKYGLTYEKEQFKIRDFIGPLMKDLDVDMIYIHDSNMKLIAQGENTAKFNINQVNDGKWKECLENASSGRRFYTIQIEKNADDVDELIMKTTLPIFHDTEKNYVLGFSTVGYKINNRFAKKIKDIIGANVIVSLLNKQIASSFYDPTKQDRNNSLNQEKDGYDFESYSGNMDILDTTYDRRFIPIISENSTKAIEEAPKLWALVNNSDIRTSLYLTIGGILVFSAMIIFMGLIVAFKIAYNIIDSTKRILIGTRHIAQKDFSYKIFLNSNDELANLAQTFNEMTDVIKDYSENLENKVAERTQALQKANTKLETTNQELERINLEINKELQMAKSLQDALLPRNIPKFKSVQIGTLYMSMGTVGGDYYDVFHINDNEIGILMADASGHGVPAALITTMAKVAFTSHSVSNKPTGEICTKVNEDMFKSIGELDNYITAFYGIVNTKTREFQYTNAGHQKAIYFNSNEAQIQELDTNGFFIGSIDEATYETKKVKLNIGDKIVFFTDGITEARNEENEFFGNERLFEFVLDKAELATEDFINELITYLNRFCGRRSQDDDQSLLVLSIIEDESMTYEAESVPLKEDYSKMIYDFETGLGYLNDGQEDKAIEIFNYIIEKNPENVQALYNLGVIYYKIGNYEKAREIWERIIRFKPNLSKVRKNLKKVDSIIRKADA